MVGIYGSSQEDRYFENKLINHLDGEGEFEDTITLEISHSFTSDDDMDEKVADAIAALEELGFKVREA